MNKYQEKRQARIDRFRELAEKNELKSTEAYKAAKTISDFIPMGQPVMIGHHSEGRHRRDLSRIDNNMRKACELSDKSAYYISKADSAERNNAISSDDPEAVRLLKEKIEKLEKLQQFMKDANKIYKSTKLTPEEKIAELVKFGVKESTASKSLQPDYIGRYGFRSFELTNNGANIRRLKQRLEQLEKRATLETTEKTYGEVRVVDNIEENRLQAFFPDKPSEEVRKNLKRSGFRWSPTNGCWQSYRNRSSQTGLMEILKSI